MDINTIRKWYRRTPEIFRKPIEYIPIKYRLGGDEFSETYSFLEKSETWSRDKLEKYQRDQLEELLQHAVETVPYYENITLTDDPFRSLERFPIVDKEIIRNNREEFKSTAYDSDNTHRVATGGTSGEPFTFLLDDTVYGKEWAFIMTGWHRVGYTPGDQLITFKGLDYEGSDEGKYWKYNPIYNTYEFSPYHLTSENIDKYIDKINEINPKYIHGYPSAIVKLANFVQDEYNNFPDIDGVLAASENVYQVQREKIENVFDTRLFSHYGLSEKAVLAAECENSTQYHLYPQYGITEILDQKGDEINVGETGEIVATGFLNRSMPFIRYRTDDYATKSTIGGCSCSREYRTLESIKGRKEKERSIYIDESNEVALHTVYYVMHGNTLDGINSIQFYQELPGKMTVRIEPKDDQKKINTDEIIDSIKNKLGSKFEIDIRFVDSVELTDSGKKQLLVQEYEQGR